MEPLPVHSKWSSNLAKKFKKFWPKLFGLVQQLFFKFRVLLSDPEKKKTYFTFYVDSFISKKILFSSQVKRYYSIGESKD